MPFVLLPMAYKRQKHVIGNYLNILSNYVKIIQLKKICAFRAASNGLLVSNSHRQYIITVMLKRRECACACLSALPFLFVAMAVAEGIEQLLMQTNLLLNSVHKNIQDDPS